MHRESIANMQCLRMDLEFVGSIVFIVQLLKIAQSDKRLFYILCLRI